MGRVHITNPVAEDVENRLKARHEVSLGYGANPVRWDSVAADVEAVVVRAESITRDMILAAPHLKIIARHGVGTDNVDLLAAEERGVCVTTAPGANARAVAEHVFALLLTIARRVDRAMTEVRAGRWSEMRHELVGVELHGSTILLIGGGQIAQLVAGIAQGFGMRVLISDPFVSSDLIEGLGATRVELEDGLRQATFVSVHVPLLPSTEGLLDAAKLALLPRGSIVVNTSRGGVIDETALRDSLVNGHLRGAATDVLAAESVDMKHPLPHNRLDLSLENLVVTPHIAGQTQESLQTVGDLVVESVEQALSGRIPQHLVRPISRKES